MLQSGRFASVKSLKEMLTTFSTKGMLNCRLEVRFAELVAYKQPDVAAILWAWAGTDPDSGRECPGVRIELNLSFEDLKQTMEEPPKPGKVGILDWEESGGVL